MDKPSRLFYAWGVLWSLPLTLLYVPLVLLYVPVGVRWSEGLLEVKTLWIIGNPGAQTVGIIMTYLDEADRDNPVLRVHERVHVIQAFWLGVFFGLIWLLHWTWNATVVRPKDPEKYPDYLPFTHKGKLLPWWWRAYVIVCFEVHAYRIDDEFQRDHRPNAWGVTC